VDVGNPVVAFRFHSHFRFLIIEPIWTLTWVRQEETYAQQHQHLMGAHVVPCTLTDPQIRTTFVLLRIYLTKGIGHVLFLNRSHDARRQPYDRLDFAL
jgi:hypothetical protein